MNSAINKSFNSLLEECGFIEKDRWAAGLLNANLIRERLNTHLRYSGLIGEFGSETDFIYEVPGPTEVVPGTPCIYFKFMDSPSPDAIARLRSKIWNHGRIPTLWIIAPDSVKIYDSFARPQEDDQQSTDNHLLGELQRIGGVVKNIGEFHKSKFDTGEFWRTGKGSSIDPSQRVDYALLRDLSTTEKFLGFQGLDSATAHALLGRVIFVKYLEDRKILKPPHFRAHGDSDGFRGLLGDKQKTYSFFKWLKATFNGDLFPLVLGEESAVQPLHLDILYRFLAGHDMSLYPETQSRLWPYSFDIIPIELISSIYEMFAHARDPQLAKAMSVHYTRFSLVELVLSLGMQGLKSSDRVLDPACGSGVFLVEAFRRLVWLKTRELGRPLNRSELHEILRKQIYGLDVDQDAVFVAAFSLYLTLLELDPDPQPPDALRLPRLIEIPETKEDHQPNLYMQDFFNVEHSFNQRPPFSKFGFDLITGNPPWTALKSTEGSPAIQRQWGIEYCRQEGIPDNKPDQAFMWRARTFLNSQNPEARVAFVVSSRIFYQTSTTAESWREKFLANNTINQVVNLSDLSSENILFGRQSSAGLPASVIIFSPKEPKIGHVLSYITPKWYSGIRKRDEILITSADLQVLSQDLLRRTPFLWKTAFWGTPRDFRLVERLCTFPTLEQVLSRSKIKKHEFRTYGITFGKNPSKDASQLKDVPFLESGADSRYRINVDKFIPFDRPFIAERSNSRKLPLPVLILNRALRNNRPCVALVESSMSRNQIILDHMYYGLSFGHVPGSLAFRLNALLNSKCVYYSAFMLSTSLGWDWRTIEPNTWMQIPLPQSIEDEDDVRWTSILDKEHWLRDNWQLGATVPDVIQAEDAINQDVYNLYGLSKQEVILVEDTIRYTIMPLLQRRGNKPFQAVFEPDRDLLASYAHRVCLQLNDLFNHQDLELSATIFTPENSPVKACRFTTRKRSDTPLVTESEIGGIHNILGLISEHLCARVADHLYVHRDLRVYDGDVIWIIKQSESRLWSEAAALNDADSIVREHMEHASNG